MRPAREGRENVIYTVIHRVDEHGFNEARP